MYVLVMAPYVGVARGVYRGGGAQNSLAPIVFESGLSPPHYGGGILNSLLASVFCLVLASCCFASNLNTSFLQYLHFLIISFLLLD